MAVIPSCDGFTIGGYANRFFGPTGKYSLALVAGTASVIAGRGSPTEPHKVEYGFGVTQVTPITDAEPYNFIRGVTPDAAGLYDLSPAGTYIATAMEIDGVGAMLVAECYIRTEADFDAPNWHIESGPTATAGPNWSQLWATDGVVTVPFGTYVSVSVGSGTVNTLTVHSPSGTDAYVGGTSVAWPAGDYQFNAVVAKNGRSYTLTLVLRVTP